MPTDGALEIFKPFAWLAATAFAVGFLSYLALGRPAEAEARFAPAPAAASDQASWPASDEWTFAKRI